MTTKALCLTCLITSAFINTDNLVYKKENEEKPQNYFIALGSNELQASCLVRDFCVYTQKNFPFDFYEIHKRDNT